MSQVEFNNPFQSVSPLPERKEPPADPFALLEEEYEVVLPAVGEKVAVKSLTVAEDIFLTRDTFMDLSSVFRKFGTVMWDSLTEQGKTVFSGSREEFFKRIHPGSDVPALLYGLLVATYDTINIPKGECPKCGTELPPLTLKTQDLEIERLDIHPVDREKLEEFYFEVKRPAGVAYVKLRYKLFDSWFDKLQLTYFLAKTEIRYVAIPAPEQLEEKLRFFHFELPNLYRIFMQLVVEAEVGVKGSDGKPIPGSVRRCFRPQTDWALTRKESFQRLLQCKDLLGKLPANVTNAFLNELTRKQEEHGIPSIEFKPLVRKCSSCGHKEEIPVEPALFFLYKVLGAL